LACGLAATSVAVVSVARASSALGGLILSGSRLKAQRSVVIFSRENCVGSTTAIEAFSRGAGETDLGRVR